MNLLIIGSGGREHAIIWKLKRSGKINKIFCIPGNGGISQLAECVDIPVFDFKKITEFVIENNIDLTIVGPEAPLVAGIVDYFNERNLKIFGPTQKAAQLEGSKVFAKQFMKKYNIPTAEFKIFDDYKNAMSFLSTCQPVNLSTVIKADGLCAGKGVFVCDSKKEAEEAIKKIMVEKVFGDSGNKVVIEEKLRGEEASVIAFCDSKDIIPLIISRDHKRVFDGDKGENTGGMGAYAPVKVAHEGGIKKILDNFLCGIKEEKLDYKGIIYVGVMLTDEGPKVLEFNVRFGDPETQAILPLMESDLLELFTATIDGKLDSYKVKWKTGFCVSVVLASGGYPGKFEVEKEIFGLGNNGGLDDSPDVIIFHSGTIRKDNKYFTNGGRVLNVAGLGNTIEEAASKAYDAIKKINFEGMHYRKDIGRKVEVQL